MDASSRSQYLSQAIAELLNATAFLTQPEATEWFSDESKWHAFREAFRNNLGIVAEAIASLHQAEAVTFWFDVRNALHLIQQLEPILFADPPDWPLIQRQAGVIVAPLLSPHS